MNHSSVLKGGLLFLQVVDYKSNPQRTGWENPLTTEYHRVYRSCTEQCIMKVYKNHWYFRISNSVTPFLLRETPCL